jgi:hypothetical protein
MQAQVLRERGIESSAATGAVRVVDPDGIGIELAAARTSPEVGGATTLGSDGGADCAT